VEGKVISGFGSRIHPITKKKEFHKGIDIVAKEGTPIMAVFDGIIVVAEEFGSYGNYVKINHGNEMYSIYAHCKKLYTRKGEKIKKGNVIASVGNTGSTTGNHLHFEVWKGNEVIDPLEIINFTSADNEN
jgi:murein DD-endopeptidase MepM/ murein hydrolase activator NlpD